MSVLKIRDESGNVHEVLALKGEKGEPAVTDQTYNPESENAQSGIAVAEATAQKPFKLIEKITLEEDAEISRNQTPDGEDYNFNEMKIVIKFTNPTSNINLYCHCYVDKYQPTGSAGALYLPNAGIQGRTGYATFTAKISPYNNGVQDNNYIADISASSSNPGASPVYSCGLFSTYQENSIPEWFYNYTGKFKRVTLGQMPAGTIIYIIAR